VVEFSKTNAKVLMTRSNRNIGARNMDYNLLEDFSSKFKEIHDNEMNEDFEEFDPLSEP